MKTIAAALMSFACLTAGAAEMTRMQAMPPLKTGVRPVARGDATIKAVDARLARFAAANAGNPAAQAALSAAAAEVRENPAGFMDSDGNPNRQSMSELLGRHFGTAGTVAIGSNTYPNLGSMGDGDIMALCFIVMMEAAKSAQDDLKNVMDGVKAINKQKQGLRETARQLDEQKANCIKDPANCRDKDIDAAREDIKNQLDSKSELGETESLRLQMAMDRVSKFMTALSNIEKKASDTDAALIQNMK